MSDLVLKVCVGLPATGKTTYARQWVEEEPTKRVRVNRDEIRKQLGKYWVPSREDLVTTIENQMIVSSLMLGYNVIVDATNLRGLDRFRKLVEQHNLKFIDVVKVNFELDIAEVIRRDSARPKADRVGAKVILRMFDKYYTKLSDDAVKSIKDEASKRFDPRLDFLMKPEDFQEMIRLPRCYIFDLDGTLSLMNGRSPYKGEDCGTDVPNADVVELLRVISKGNPYADIKIFSGRNGESQFETEQWLKDNNIDIKPMHIHMREPGDFRPDTEVKQEMFNNHIVGKYWVQCIFDDRDVMVKHWRDQGLTCLQVYYGDF